MGFVQQATKKVEKAATEVFQPIEKAVVTPVAKAVERVAQDPIKAVSDLVHDTGKNTGLNDVVRGVGMGIEDLAKDVGKGVEDLGKGLGLGGGGGQTSSAPTQKAADTPAVAQGMAETAIAGGEAPEAGPTKGGPDVKLRTKVNSGQQQKRRQKFGIGSSKTGVNI